MPPELQNKHILVDTNVLSNIFYNPDNFQGFLKDLEDLSCKLCINDLIKLEFIRIARSKTEKEIVLSFIDNNFICLPNLTNITAIANDLYPLYNFCSSIKNHKQVSIVDALNASFLKNYGNNLYFVTLDNNDYPLEILDRIATGTIDINTQILTWGLYRFNVSNYDSLLEKYNLK